MRTMTRRGMRPGAASAADVGPGAARVDGRVVAVRMTRIHPSFGKGHTRRHGRKIQDRFLFQVKAPAESRYPRDEHRELADTTSEQAFRPKPEGHCVMVKA